MKFLFFVLHCFLIGSFHGKKSKVDTQDQTSPRANTLFDDPDDIQKQLDNEAFDRNKLGKFKTVWVLHLPTQLPSRKMRGEETRSRRQATTSAKKTVTAINNQIFMLNGPEDSPTETYPMWDYKEQNKWAAHFPACGGASQSPVNLPYSGLDKTKGARKMIFSNYDKVPKSMWLYNDGRTATMFGDWAKSDVPVIYGGAAHNRCYLFHSLVLHWPSEHAVAGLQYPLETQALFVSSIYGSMDEALASSNSDQLAFLTVSTLYKFSNCSHKGTFDLLAAVVQSQFGNNTLETHPFQYYSPKFKEYVAYQGSLSRPPCTESVLWLIRAKALPVSRNVIKSLQERIDIGDSLQFNSRLIQRMNDRRVYMFN